MHRSISLVSLAAAPILLSGCGSLDRATGVATGFVSHQLCSAAFVSNVEPETFYREAIAPSLGPVEFLVSHKVDRERAEVTATLRRTAHQPVGLSRSARLPRPARRSAGAGEPAANDGRPRPAAADCRPRARRARRPGLACRSRSRVRGASRATPAPDQGDRRGARRPHHRRALCRRLHDGHPAARLVGDQVGHQCPARHPGAPGQDRRAGSGAGRAPGPHPAIRGTRSRSTICCA